MELAEIKEKYVFTTRIDIDDDNFVELREPAQCEIIKMGSGDGNELKKLEEIFPDCLINHSFTKNGSKASPVDVYNALKESGSLLTEILTTWLESVPFQQRLKKNAK